jgi:multisubunit Na+/H+ antiporter MnhE subunit
MSRLLTLVALGLVFVREVIVGGATTAWFILRPGARPAPMLVRMPYAGLSPTGAALLACLVTLTPGTSAVDLDVERRCLLLHLLDGRDPKDAVAGIRRKFERRLRPLFPEART